MNLPNLGDALIFFRKGLENALGVKVSYVPSNRKHKRSDPPSRAGHSAGERANMQARIFGLICGFVAGVLPLASLAQSLELVSVQEDWRIYRDNATSPTCFVYAEPSTWSAARDGQPVSVERGDIRFFITVAADAPDVTEPSFRAGYTLTTDSAATVSISGVETSLYPNAEYCAQTGSIDRCEQYAWTQPADDAALIGAMQAGSDAIVTARSQRGTVTTDTFSLTGFTAALNDAREACSQ